jgi:hypothetical protein
MDQEVEVLDVWYKEDTKCEKVINRYAHFHNQMTTACRSRFCTMIASRVRTGQVDVHS